MCGLFMTVGHDEFHGQVTGVAFVWMPQLQTGPS
jgi:hypothetical protein